MGSSIKKIALHTGLALGGQLFIGQALAFEASAGALIPQATSLPQQLSALAPSPRPVLVKGSAILGGQVSALALISARQNGQAALAELLPAMASPVPRAAVYRPSDSLNSAAAQATVPAFLSKSGSPDIFGSVALHVSRTPLDSKWYRASADRSPGLAAVVAAFRSHSEARTLELVNDWVNKRIKYSDDVKEYGVADHWASASQALARGRGDCEDYAITKMQMLRALGFSRNDMYLAIVKDLVRRSDHAVLIVRSEGRFIILDNSTDELLDASMAQDYRPILTYSAHGKWAHGYRQEPVARIRMAGRSIDSAQPALP